MKRPGRRALQMMLALICLIAVPAVLVSLQSFAINQVSNDAIKLLMPGTYKLQLKKQSYDIWVFSQWNSVGVNTASSKNIVYFEPKVEIATLDGKQIRLEPLPSNFISLYEPSKNLGRPAYNFESSEGSYLVSCATQCVIAFVPQAAIKHSWTNRNVIPSFENDNNFLEKPPGNSLSR